MPSLVDLDATPNDPAARHKYEFAAKIRAARAILGWSQKELSERVGLTQKSIHRIEQGSVDVRRSTALTLEQALMEVGLQFEALAGGGFKVVVSREAIAPLRSSE